MQGLCHQSSHHCYCLHQLPAHHTPLADRRFGRCLLIQTPESKSQTPALSHMVQGAAKRDCMRSSHVGISCTTVHMLLRKCAVSVQYRFLGHKYCRQAALSWHCSLLREQYYPLSARTFQLQQRDWRCSRSSADTVGKMGTGFLTGRASDMAYLA